MRKDKPFSGSFAQMRWLKPNLRRLVQPSLQLFSELQPLYCRDLNCPAARGHRAKIFRITRYPTSAVQIPDTGIAYVEGGDSRPKPRKYDGTAPVSDTTNSAAEIRQDWLGYLLSTEPADRPRAE